MKRSRTPAAPLPPVLASADLQTLLDRHAVRLLDVRTPGEFETAHIPGSYNVPLDTLGEHATELETDGTSPLVLVCQSGTRARKAEAALHSADLRHVHVLDGGLNGWIAAGGPVTRGAKRVSLERQVRMVAGGLVATGAALALLVHPLFALLPLGVGGGLLFAGATDTCMMGVLLAKLPFNRAAKCDVEAMVSALKAGVAPAGLQTRRS